MEAGRIGGKRSSPLDHTLGFKVGDDEANTRIEFTGVPLNYGHDAAFPVP